MLDPETKPIEQIKQEILQKIFEAEVKAISGMFYLPEENDKLIATIAKLKQSLGLT